MKTKQKASLHPPSTLFSTLFHYTWMRTIIFYYIPCFRFLFFIGCHHYDTYMQIYKYVHPRVWKYNCTISDAYACITTIDSLFLPPTPPHKHTRTQTHTHIVPPTHCYQCILLHSFFIVKGLKHGVKKVEKWFQYFFKRLRRSLKSIIIFF